MELSLSITNPPPTPRPIPIGSNLPSNYSYVPAIVIIAAYNKSDNNSNNPHCRGQHWLPFHGWRHSVSWILPLIRHTNPIGIPWVYWIYIPYSWMTMERAAAVVSMQPRPRRKHRLDSSPSRAPPMVQYTSSRPHRPNRVIMSCEESNR